jgi:hypothetical protein
MSKTEFLNVDVGSTYNYHSALKIKRTCASIPIQRETRFTTKSVTLAQNTTQIHNNQWSKWAGICRYTIPELLFVPEFHTCTYQYII